MHIQDNSNYYLFKYSLQSDPLVYHRFYNTIVTIVIEFALEKHICNILSDIGENVVRVHHKITYDNGMGRRVSVGSIMICLL